MSERTALTRATATRYRSASKGAKAVILDELCATMGWDRDHARKALRNALGPKRAAKSRTPRPPTYGEEVMAALRKVWASDGCPGRQADGAVPARDCGPVAACTEFDTDDETVAKLYAMSAATIDRRLAGERKRLEHVRRQDRS